MTGLSVLYIGGTGTISASCVAESVRQGHDVAVLNRGQSAQRAVPAGVSRIVADIADSVAVREAVTGRHFDAVVNFVSYTAEQAADAVQAFADHAGQYVHISSASIYHKPVRRLPLIESTPRHNPFSRYSQEKIAAEEAVLRLYAEREAPVTVVRPSHTYDDARPPFPGDWTEVHRLLHGQPLVVSGDGTAPWTVTHARDFAVGLAGLLGNPQAIGETFHITSDEALPWDEIYQTMGAAAGVTTQLVHLPAELLALAAPDWRWSSLIMGDLRYSAVFDNSKIRRYVPAFHPTTTWAEGARRLLAWRAAHPDACRPDPHVGAILDRLTDGYRRAEQLFRSLAPDQE
jgi:nucleoside-diphosphate-sugar epimerase